MLSMNIGPDERNKKGCRSTLFRVGDLPDVSQQTL